MNASDVQKVILPSNESFINMINYISQLTDIDNFREIMLYERIVDAISGANQGANLNLDGCLPIYHNEDPEILDRIRHYARAAAGEFSIVLANLNLGNRQVWLSYKDITPSYDFVIGIRDKSAAIMNVSSPNVNDNYHREPEPTGFIEF